MGTLGAYLREAREAMGLDIREAAQQTRISVNYLKALEQEDFSKLPGEVFVKGFLKNYGRFLNISESELMKRYGELKMSTSSSNAQGAAAEQKAELCETAKSEATPVEPFVWGAGVFIALIAFLFTATPENRRQSTVHQPVSGPTLTAAPGAPETPAKLYLEVVALEDAWVLVRTDFSPQKKAVLKKGESLIWSADERFLLSYSRVGALKLLLNGEELAVIGAKGAVVRDLTVTASGIVGQSIPTELPRPRKTKPVIQAEQPPQPQTQTQTQNPPSPQETAPLEEAPSQPSPPSLSPSPQPQSAPAEQQPPQAGPQDPKPAQ